MSIPTAALIFCGTGLAGLFLPIIDAHVGLNRVTDLNQLRETVNRVDTSVIGIPLVGVVLGVVFLALMVLPALDLVMRRVRWTKLLAVPAGIGLIPMVLFTVVAIWFGGEAARFAGFVGEDVAVLGVGAGAVLLIVAEFGLVGASSMAIIAARKMPAEERGKTPHAAPPTSSLPPRDPNL